MTDPFYIRVKAKTNQKKEELLQISENQFTVSLREKAQRGEANKRIIELFRIHYKNSNSQVRIISGAYSPIKLLKIG